MDPAKEGRGGKFLRQAATSLAFIRREGGYVNQSSHLGVVARLGDDRPTIRMPHQEYGAFLCVDHAVGGCYILCNRGKRVLNGYYVQTPGLQEGDHFGPA